MMGIPSCREVARTLAEGEFRGASWRTRLMTRLHLAMCRHCARFSRQIEMIAMTLKAMMNRQLDGFNRPDVIERIIARLKRSS